MKEPLSQTLLRYTLSVLLLAACWTLIGKIFSVPRFLLPPPLQVLITLGTDSRLFVSATRFTLLNAVSGGLIGITLGLAVGALIAYSKVLRWLFEPYLVIFQSFPRESLFPLLIVWLGFGTVTKIVNATLLSFFPVAVLSLSGLTDTRREYIDILRGWGATHLEEFIHCRIPAFVPAFIGAVKVAWPLSLIGAVLGEFMGGNEGLGYMIISAGSSFRTDRLFGAVTILGLVGVLGLVVIQTIQDRFLRRFNQE